MSHASMFSERDAMHSPKHRHEVQFYQSNAFLSEAVARYLAEGFQNGNAMVVIARAEHREAFRGKLTRQGFDVDVAMRSGQFRECDAEETLKQFMEGELPNRERFDLVVGQVIEESRKSFENSPVLAYGEMVDILWQNGRREAAIRLEELWNELSESRPFELFCAYALNGFYKQEHHADFEQICKTHSRVYPTERWMKLPEDERLLRITLLEQEAFALSAELEHRKDMERGLLEALDEKRRIEEKLRKTESQLRGVLQNAAEYSLGRARRTNSVGE